MSFKETTCYTAVCDGCGEEAEYDEYCGYATKESAVACADGWIEADGKLTCADCRPCELCGGKGGQSGDYGFLCHSCWRQPCVGCGHQLRWHSTPTANSPGNCSGVAVVHDDTTIEFCACVVFIAAGAAEASHG